MNEKIWNVDYIRENPEIAAKAIETLQTALADTESQLHRIRTLVQAVGECLAEESQKV